MKQKLLFILVSSFLLSQDLDHIIFSRVTITPTEAEMVAIYNPRSESVNLSNYYLTDAEKPSSEKKLLFFFHSFLIFSILKALKPEV